MLALWVHVFSYGLKRLVKTLVANLTAAPGDFFSYDMPYKPSCLLTN